MRTGRSMKRSSSANGDDLVHQLADAGAREAVDRAVEVDVLAAREVRVEAGAELEQRRDAAAGLDAAGGRLEDPARRASAASSCPSRCGRRARPPRPARPSSETSRSAHTSRVAERPRATKMSLSVRCGCVETRNRCDTRSTTIRPGVIRSSPARGYTSGSDIRATGVGYRLASLGARGNPSLTPPARGMNAA